MENVYACMKLVRVETFSSIVWVAFICPYQYLVESLHHNYDTDNYINNFTDNQNHNERDVSRENINWKKNSRTKSSSSKIAIIKWHRDRLVL